MANTTQDSTLLSDSTGKEVTDKVVESEGGAVEDATTRHLGESSSSTPFVAGTDPHVEATSSQNSTNAQAAAPPPRPSLVPLGPNHPQSTPTAPHPKKFNAMNINKMFLEKNSSASSASAATSASSVAKSGSPVARPTAQPANSHSRLVTTKLTASPAVSSTAGWSRPSSVAPPPVAATNSPTNASPLPTTTAIQTSITAAPQLPHIGKVIQPQPRAAIVTSVSSQKDSGSSKPVWGNVKPPTIPMRPDIQPSDFPTAAEVANVSSTRRQPKQDDAKSPTESDSAARQARMEEADTFRGLHLDPNAHHWDEMEEDDDNFLGGVIEFGDGRQYKIESNEPQQSSSPHVVSRALQGDGSAPPSGPVSKEDRFVDDFDRSWPRSRPSPPFPSRDVPPPPAARSSSPTVSPVIPQATHSPQDSSRVLFNERSNRLEPYSQSHRAQGPFPKRPNHLEGSVPLNDARGSRDGPSNIQVLQKPGSDFPSRGRRFSGSGGGSGQASHFDRQKDRDHATRRDGPPPSPRLHRAAEAEVKDREFTTERGRRTTMGPPQLPPHAMPKQAQDGGRQLPPHLTQVSPNIPPRRLSSRDSRFTPSETTPPSTLPPLGSVRLPSQSPVLSNASQVLVSPAGGPSVPLPLNGADLDEVRKDVMQSAAARAKQRRQQEEAEREAQKERARRKAAELEEKMKVTEAAKAKALEEEKAKAAREKEALDIIESAARSVEPKTPSTESQAEPTIVKSASRRPPSLAGLSAQAPSEAPHSAGIRRPGPVPPRSASGTVAPSSAAETDSWRSKANPLPRPAPYSETRPSAVPSASFITTPSAVEQIESIADGGRDELEVVDFSDMGKFVGAPEAIAQPSESSSDLKAGATGSLRTRPVASDFFDEPVTSNQQHDFNAWRRKVSQDYTHLAPPLPAQKQPEEATIINETQDSEAPTTSVPPTQDQPRGVSDTIPDTTSKESPSLLDQPQGDQALPVPIHFNSQRSPRNQTFYKEAAMSALDDAMSRIKGALVGMHAQEPPKDGSSQSSSLDEQPPTRSGQPPQAATKTTPKDRWVPPALRPRSFDIGDEPQEVFLVTIVNPLPSPSSTPATVKFPSVSRPVEFIHRKQLQSFFRQPFQLRMDILSFDPPVPDMHRRTLSLNDVLFRRPPGGFRFRYRVMLPRTRGPKVHIPASTPTKANGVGAFGRPTPAEGAASWRKPVVPADDSELSTGLNTMSRSPPPQAATPKLHVTSIPKSSEHSPNKSDNGLTPIRSRSQPKMPAGSAVAFYRDSRIDVVEADVKPSVNFIVGSELDDSKTSQEYLTDTKVASSPRPLNGGGLETTSGSTTNTPASTSRVLLGDKEIMAPPLTSTKSESKSSNDSADRVLATPPNHHSASWARASVSLPIKESPARAPDPEHLKALWSQNTNKTTLHPVNSLEGIADDLTALPFTLQDVKSEDGETPPPSLPSAPSRMSLHEVTRAFQQVPASSSSNQPQHRVTISPPSTSAPVARPTYVYSPLSQNNMRPAYPPYGSPSMSQSPAPVMYHSSPVPSRMQPNGHQPMTPLYAQPLWLPMAGPGSQNNMMRPVTSPYQAPMMAYGSPGYPPQPSTGLMPTSPQGQNGGRGRGMPVLSPVMSHAHAHHMPNMYGGSPVLLHPMQQGHGYAPPIPAGRGQPPRAENGHGIQQPPHSTQGAHHPAPHPSFNATSPFVRSGW